MTDQELRERFTDHAGHYELSKRLDAMMVICKAYADAQVAAKDAEIKRLRDFANQCQKSPEKLVKMNWFEDGSFDYCDLVPLQDAATNALSPAPVTEGTKPPYTIHQAKEVFASRRGKTWSDLLHQFDIGSGISKQMDMEQAMEYVAEIYKNEDQEWATQQQ